MSENNAITLPELSSETIARIENAVFDEIGDEHRPASAPASTRVERRRRRWMTALGVAAAFVGGILIAPPLLSSISTGSSPSGVSADYAVSGATMSDGDSSGAIAESSVDDVQTGLQLGSELPTRDIITVADVTLRVSNIEKAAESIRKIAADHRGYVEQARIGTSRVDAAEPVPNAERGSITIRIPAADLDKVMTAIDGDGDVLDTSISREDVTSTAVDLRARVAAGEASVKRLTELMSKSGSVADLIAAEKALSDRQAQLESYQQQLKSLDERVAMSTITIALTRQTSATQADPAGFGDGLLAGWNGLIVALNAVVIALGFLLPWLGVAAVVLIVIWLIRRGRRRSRNS